MKISIDDQQFFELSDIQIKVIKNDVQDELFDDDIKRRLEYVLRHKYERCFQRLQDEWCSPGSDGKCKLEKCGVTSIPTSPDELAKVIFAQSEYMNRSQREQIAKAEAQINVRV